MHCICEGVVEQHLNMWFGRSNENTSFPCFIGNQSNEIDKELLSIKPTSEITRKPRKIADRKDWKGKLLNFLIRQGHIQIINVQTGLFLLLINLMISNN